MQFSSTDFRQRKLTIAALLLLGLISLLAIWSRGPVGPASITSKELAEHLSTSAEVINAELQDPREVAADTLSLSFALALKHRIKSVYSPERDQLLAIALQSNAPPELRKSIQTELGEYELGEFNAVPH